MPTSKDILKDAAKVLDKNKLAKMAYEDSIDMGVKDTAAYAKARAELTTSINSMSGLVKNAEAGLKQLNKGLTSLRKNEPVMKAPADKKAYDRLLQTYAASIKEGMTLHQRLGDTLKKAAQILKSK